MSQEPKQPPPPQALLILNPGASPLFTTAGQSVRCEHGKVVEIAQDLEPRAGERVIDARNCALVPGLHDHHLHLLAAAAASASIDCTGKTKQTLIASLKAAKTTAHIRAVNYHESIAGPLDRTTLDRWVAEKPLRLQHSTGQMWFLNSRAIADLGLESDEHASHKGIERDPYGHATGRLFRADSLLAASKARLAPDLTTLSAELAGFGVTGVTDTSYNNSDEEFELLASKQSSGELLQHVRMMGNESLHPQRQGNIHTGELKLLLDEAELPDLDELTDAVHRAHADNRGVAMHCVTRIELAVAFSIFAATGVKGDRIEHASVMSEGSLSQMRELGLTAVTQPGFVHAKGDRYLTELTHTEITELYRLRSLVDANIPLALSSDAPYGPVNPWLNMQSSVDRKSSTGKRLSFSEALSQEQALAAYCGMADAPATPRQVKVGAAADLAILNAPWQTVREDLASTCASTTIREGHLIHGKFD